LCIHNEPFCIYNAIFLEDLHGRANISGIGDFEDLNDDYNDVVVISFNMAEVATLASFLKSIYGRQESAF
jgi:hypothetical protein